MKGLHACKFILLVLVLLNSCSPMVDGEGDLGPTKAVADSLDRAKELSESAPLASSKIALEALAAAQQANDPALEATAQLILCTYTTPPLAVDTTLVFCEKALVHYVGEGDLRQEGILLNSMGILHDIKGEKEKAVDFFKQAEQLFLQLEDLEWLGQVYNNWGVVYVTENSLEKATQLYLKALEVNETASNRKGLMATHCNLGRLYYKQRLYTEAKGHAEKGVLIAKETQNATWLPLSLNLRGDIYFQTGEMDLALQSYEEARSISAKNRDDYNLIFTLNRLGRLYIAKEDYRSALSYVEQALDRSRIAGKRKDLEEVYLSIGECHTELGHFDIAKPYIDTAYFLAQQNRDHKYLSRAYRQYGDWNYKLGNYKISISFLTRRQMLMDSISRLENAELLSRLEREFKRKEQDEEISALREQATQQNLFLVILSGLIGMVVIIASGLFFYYRKIRKFNEELEFKVQERTEALKQSNIHLERFAYIASHDLKTPLRTISSFLSLIKRRIKIYNNPELEDLLSFASNGAKQMNNLIEDVLEFSQVSTSEFKKEAVDLNETIRSVMYNIDNFLQEKAGLVVYKDLPEISGNGGYLHQLFQNLIVNGIKYNTSDPPRVCITYVEEEQHYRFCVEDNGIGIDPAYQETVFEMFKRLHTSAEYEGTGIGLALCKKIVEQHGGELWLEYSSPAGSQFCFTLPKETVPSTTVAPT